MCEETDFWRAASVLINNFSILNKNICLTILKCAKVLSGIATITDIDSLETLDKIAAVEYFSLNPNLLYNFKNENSCEGIVFIVKFLQKKTLEYSHGCFIADFKSLTITCKPFDGNCDVVNFIVRFDKGEISIQPRFNIDSNRYERSKNILQKKFVRWMTEVTPSDICKINTHNLIDGEDYVREYGNLKRKYAKNIVQIWPEVTDPKKYVYEDIAIAAYLIVFWKKFDIPPKGFVDVGCGNGLLVYILHSEGYNGYGIDVRRREIWALYPPGTRLQEETINPPSYSVSEDIDWIIGNHSDELSAWIPIIACLSSYNTKYFLLPCCAYELNGDKYKRRNCKYSTYYDFQQYILEISSKCGFSFLTERLRIPSTKRIAFIGKERKYEPDKHENIVSDLRNFITNEIGSNDMKLRNYYQEVRNCTQIDRKFANKIYLKIFNYMLKQNSSDGENSSSSWNTNCKVSLKDIAQCVSPDELALLKSEYGGLKTLLKSKHEVFVIIGDAVQIRYPIKKRNKSSLSESNFKKRTCFFHLYHPNGCPLSDSECTFLHDNK